jgi:hypothetical protein
VQLQAYPPLSEKLLFCGLKFVLATLLFAESGSLRPPLCTFFMQLAKLAKYRTTKTDP